MDYEKEIPFGAFDSELMHQEIYIPKGFEATIEGNKIILTRTESKDDEIRKELLRIVKENKGSIYISLAPRIKSFLISLLEKKTWSEEDEKLLYLTVDNLEDIMSRYGELYGLVGKCITWVKSLKGRVQHKNHWKPSEEQMKALFVLLPTVCNSNPIFSLYEDLKKL